LLSSTLTWILAYLLFRYSLLKGEIASSDFLVSLGIGTLLAMLLIGGLFLGKVSGLSKSHKTVS
jgi:sulfite exporter TauE/SafE